MRIGGARAALGLLVLAAAAGVATAGGERTPTPSPDGARVYFISPHDGDTVTSPVTVRFGLSGMGVAPAGVAQPNTGHHHLIVDGELPPLDQPLPSDEHHRHFGGGQTETVIELSPGPHTLQLVLADHEHVPHVPPVISERITITVR